MNDSINFFYICQEWDKEDTAFVMWHEMVCTNDTYEFVFRSTDEFSVELARMICKKSLQRCHKAKSLQMVVVYTEENRG